LRDWRKLRVLMRACAFSFSLPLRGEWLGGVKNTQALSDLLAHLEPVFYNRVTRCLCAVRVHVDAGFGHLGALHDYDEVEHFRLRWVCAADD
jgi:hypothetical protein